MTEWLNKVFSGSVSLSRANPVGIFLMALAIALLFAARPLSGRFPEEKRESAMLSFKILGLLLCALGAIISIH